MTIPPTKNSIPATLVGTRLSLFRDEVFSTLIIFILGLCGNMVHAQQPKKVPRIGYLSGIDAATETGRSEAIRLALRELGYIVGQNIAIEYRYGEGKSDRYAVLAAELVRL